jgi:type IV/VI secretion system ImpK/VasF family protein
MNLAEFCAPIFTLVCELNRARARSEPVDLAKSRARCLRILSELDKKAENSRDVNLLRRWKRIKQPLVFFVDGMVANSQLAGRASWQRIAHELFDNLAGDEDFFREHLDKVLNTDDADSRELLLVFYICLGLGYYGMYASEPGAVLERQERIRQRLGDVLEVRPDAYLCRGARNDAYFADTEGLPPPADTRVAFWAVVFACALVLLSFAYATGYVLATGKLRGTLDNIVTKAEKAPR